jgi:hypothetical protein
MTAPIQAASHPGIWIRTAYNQLYTKTASKVKAFDPTTDVYAKQFVPGAQLRLLQSLSRLSRSAAGGSRLGFKDRGLALDRLCRCLI